MSKLYAYLALGAVLIGASIWLYNWAYNNGVTAERVVWTESQNKAVAAKQKVIDKLAYDYAQAINENSNQYQKGLQDGQVKKANVIASVNAGTIRLRDKHAADCNVASITSIAPAGGRDATEKGGLSRPLTDFLIGLASEADDVVKQLTACQQNYNALYLTCSARQVF